MLYIATLSKFRFGTTCKGAGDHWLTWPHCSQCNSTWPDTTKRWPSPHPTLRRTGFDIGWQPGASIHKGRGAWALAIIWIGVGRPIIRTTGIFRFYSNLYTWLSGLCYRKYVCRPYRSCALPSGLKFRQYFFAIFYLSYPLTSVKILRRSSQGNPSIGDVKRKRGNKIQRCRVWVSHAHLLMSFLSLLGAHWS